MFTRGISVGRVLGVRVSLHPSLLVVFGLVVLTLGAGAFPRWHPEWGALQAWGTALAAAVLFFASVVAHELGHALVARRFGLGVRRIHLYLFGGAADVEDTPQSPKREAALAAVGPLVSLVIAIGCLLTSALAVSFTGAARDTSEATLRAMGPALTLLAWLGPVNLVLAVFNSIPAFPLDGGRVLRAGLWQLTGSFERATRWAARVGQALALVMVGLGIAMAFGARVPLLGGGVVGGVWLALLGWFLGRAAVASYQAVIVRETLEEAALPDLLRQRPVISKTATVGDLARLLARRSGDLCLVTVDGEPEGYARVSDLRRLPRSRWEEAQVAEIATSLSTAPRLRADERATRLMTALRDTDVAVVVTEQDEPLGIVAWSDVVRWLEIHGSSRFGGTPSVDAAEPQRS